MTTIETTDKNANDPIYLTDELIEASEATDETLIVGIYSDGTQRILEAEEWSTWRQGNSAYFQLVAAAAGWVEGGEWQESGRGVRTFRHHTDENGRDEFTASAIEIEH